MNAWLLKKKDMKVNEVSLEIVFADKINDALVNVPTTTFAQVEIEIERAPYADDLENNQSYVKELLFERGFETHCPQCTTSLSINNRKDFSIQSDGSVAHNAINCRQQAVLNAH